MKYFFSNQAFIIFPLDYGARQRGFPDEDEEAMLCFIFGPFHATLACKGHVYALADQFVFLAVHPEEAFHAIEPTTVFLQKLGEPCVEFVDVYWPVLLCQRESFHIGFVCR